MRSLPVAPRAWRWMPAALAALLLSSCGAELKPPVLQSIDLPGPSPMRERTVFGEAQAGTIIEIFDGAGCFPFPSAESPVAGDGKFNVSVLVRSNEQSQLWGRVRDSAGNQSPCSAAGVAYVHDDQPPPAPRLERLTPVPPAKEGKVVLEGTAEPDSTVYFHSDPGCSSDPLEATPATQGAFSVPLQVSSAGEHAFHARAVDPAGNVGPCSTGLTFVLDLEPPAPPTFHQLLPEGPSNENAPILFGDAEPGGVVRIFSDPSCEEELGQPAPVGPNGAFVFYAYVAPNTTTRFHAVTEDWAGTWSDCVYSGFTYVEDSAPPLVPVLTGSSPRSPGRGTDPWLYGESEPGSRVRLFLDPTCVGTPVAQGLAENDGFALQVSVGANSSTAFFATAHDAAGNVSGCFGGFAYVEDSLPPGPPTGLQYLPLSPSFERAPRLEGTTEALGRVLVYADASCAGAPVAEAFANPLGVFAAQLIVPADAATSYFVVAEDRAGNPSTCTAAGAYRHDGVAPSAAAAQVRFGQAVDTDRVNEAFGLSARWWGFTDDRGVTGFEASVSSNERCAGDVAPPVGLPADASSTTLPASPLPQGKAVVFCVRARDAAGNWSRWAFSDRAVVDHDPLEVVRVTPGEDAGDVDPGAVLAVEFSYPVNPASVDASKFRLEGPAGPVPGTVELAGAVATFRPAARLSFEGEYTATISAALDYAGNGLAAPYAWSFRVRAARWSEPLALGGLEELLHLSVAVGGDGRAFVAASGGPEGSPAEVSVRLFVHEPGSVSGATELELADGFGGSVAVAADAAGRAFAAFARFEPDLTAHQLFVRGFDPQLGWGVATSIPLSFSGAMPEALTLALSEDGEHGVLLWVEDIDELWASVYSAGEWGVPERVAAGLLPESTVAAVVGEEDTAFVAWTDGGGVIRGAVFEDGAWAGPEEIAPFAEVGIPFRLSARGGAVLAVWGAEAYQDTEVQLRIREADGNWSDVIPAGGGLTAQSRVAAVLWDGLEATVAWSTSGDVRVRRLSAAGWAGPAEKVLDGPVRSLDLVSSGPDEARLAAAGPGGVAATRFLEGWLSPQAIDGAAAGEVRLATGGGPAAAAFAAETAGGVELRLSWLE